MKRGYATPSREEPAGGWEELAAFLAALSEEGRERFARHAALDLPAEEERIAATLWAYAGEKLGSTPSVLLATTGARAVGDPDFARTVGRAALSIARTREERQLAHVCLAQTHFRNRREAEDLAAFEEHCRAAVDLGHTGTFCYERLTVLYEYRGEREEAARICRRAIEVLEAAGDPRSAERYRRRLQRLSGGSTND